MLEDFEAALKHMWKYRWWYGSGVFHVVLILTIYFIGPYELHKEQDEAKKAVAQDFVRKAYKKDIDRKLDDIRKIEDVIDRMNNGGSEEKTEADNELIATTKDSDSNKADANKKDQDKALVDEKEDTPSTTENQNENSLVSQVQEAQKLLQNIQQLNLEKDAEKLAYLADMPLDRAFDEIKNAAPKIAQLNTEQLENMSQDEIRDTMNDYHEQARDFLETAVKEESKEQQGLNVSLTPKFNTDSNNTDANNANKSDANGKGGNGSEDGKGKSSMNAGSPSGMASSALAEAQDILHGSGGGGMGAVQTGSGQGSAHFNYDPNARVNNTRPKELVSNPRNQVAGRSIGAGGALADRIYIDTWYMIGPFDYSGRNMRDTPHPPELDVDLDAIYLGKGGRYISWEYRQSTAYPIVPDNGQGDATYYGFTEVHFDEPTTAMLGIGCDDDCKVWINDHLAWKSGDAFKPWYVRGGFPVLQHNIENWSLIEDYTKVHFPKGTTRLKFRLDNGYSLLFFALSIEKMR